MKTLKNRDELKYTIDLYKKGTVSETALESVLGEALSELLVPNIVSVKICGGDQYSTSGFLPLPIKVREKISIDYLLNRTFLKDLTESEDILLCMEQEAAHYHSVLKDFYKFMKREDNEEIPLKEALVFFLRQYISALERLHEGNPELVERLHEKKALQLVRPLKFELKALEEDDDEIRLIIERLVVSKGFPKEYLDAAKEISIKSCEEVEEKVDIMYNDEEPTKNLLGTHIRPFVDGTYTKEKLHKIIDHKYIPDTNQ